MNNVCKIFSQKDFELQISKACVQSSKLGMLKGPDYFKKEIIRMKNEAKLTVDPEQQINLLKEALNTFYNASETPLGRYVATILQPAARDLIFSERLNNTITENPVSSNFEETGKSSNKVVQKNFLNQYFKNAPNAKLYFQRNSKIDLIETFLVNRSGENPRFYESQEEMNQSVMNYKQSLLDTIFKYLESINKEGIDIKRNMYENNKYTMILNSKTIKALFESELSPKIFLQQGVKKLDQYYSNYRDKQNLQDKLFLDAYNAWIILQNFDTVVKDTIGYFIKIKGNKNNHDVDYHKYEMNISATNIWRTWTSSDDIADIADVVSDITQDLIETSKMYKFGSGEAYPDRYVSFADFNHIIGKVKNLINDSKITKVDLNTLEWYSDKSYDTLQVILEIALDNNRSDIENPVTFKQLLSRINENPQKYFHVVFDLLCNTNLLNNISDNYKLNDFEKNLLWSFNKEMFGQGQRSLYRLHNQVNNGSIYGVITQLAASTFPEEFVQYYERDDGTIGTRLLREYTVDKLKNNLFQQIQQKSVALNRNMWEKYHMKYSERDNGKYLASLIINVGKDNPLLTITSYSGSVDVQINGDIQEIWNDLDFQDLVKDLLGLDFQSDPDLKNAYYEQHQSYRNSIKELSEIIGRAAFNALVNKTYILKNNVSNRDQLKNFITNQYGDKSSDYLQNFSTKVPILPKSYKDSNLDNLATAIAMNNSLLSSAQSKTGEGTSISNFTLSRLRNCFQNQIEMQCKNKDSVVKDLTIVNDYSDVFQGVMSKREIKTQKTNQQSIKFSDHQAVKLGFLCDFIAGLVPNPGNNQFIKNGKTSQLPTVNSDKPQIDCLLTVIKAKSHTYGKTYAELSDIELENEMILEFGNMYDGIIHNINTELKKITDLIYKNIPYQIEGNTEIVRNHNLINLINKAFINDTSLGDPKNRVLNGLHKITLEYNKNHFRNPIKLAQHVHFMLNNGTLGPNHTLEALWGRFNPEKIDQDTEEYLKSLYSKEPKYLDFIERNYLNKEESVHTYFQYKNYLTAENLLKMGFNINLYGPEAKTRYNQSEIQFLRGTLKVNDSNTFLQNILKELKENWVSSDGKMVIAKGTINGQEINISTIDQLYQATNIRLHPMLSKLNRYDFLTTQQYVVTTVGSHFAHSAKPKEGKVLTEESNRFSASNKRNVAETSTVYLYQKNVLDGAPSTLNLAIIDDPTFDLYSLMGDLYKDGHKPLDGSMPGSAWMPELLNNSLGGERVGNIQKPFGTFYDETVAGGGIIKTAFFPATNDLMRNHKTWRNLQKLMSNRKWLSEQSGPNGENIYEIIPITENYLGKPINYQEYIKGDIMYKRQSDEDPSIMAAYKLDKIESLGDNKYIIYESEIDNKGNVISESKPRTEILFDSEGKVIKNNIITIDNNWDLFTQVFGGYNSLELDANGELTWSENSNKLMVYAMNNVGRRKSFEHIKDEKLKNYLKNKTKGLDQTDIWQPLKYSDIHFVPNIGAIKSLQYNVNRDHQAVFEGRAELNHFSIRLAQFGIQLDKEHHADSSEVSMPTQIMQAAANKGYTTEYTQELYTALQTLTRLEIQPFLDGIKNIIKSNSDSSDQQSKLVEEVTNIILDNIINSKDEESPVKTILKDIQEKAERGEKISYVDDIKGKVAWSDSTVMNNLFSILSTSLSNLAIKVKLSGSLSIICPTDPLIKFYGDRTLSSFETITTPDGSTKTLNAEDSLIIYQNNVREGKEVDSNGKNMLVFDISRDIIQFPKQEKNESIEDYENRIKKISNINKLSKLSELKTQHNYIIEFQDGSVEKITYNTPPDYYKIKKLVLNGKKPSVNISQLDIPLNYYDLVEKYKHQEEELRQYFEDDDLETIIYKELANITDPQYKGKKLSLNDIKKETVGLSRRHKISDFKGFVGSFVNSGGITIEQFAHNIWESLPTYLNESVDTSVIRDMVINALMSTSTRQGFTQYLNNKINDSAEQKASEEYRTYEQYIYETYKMSAEDYENYYNSIKQTIPVVKIYEDVQKGRSLSAYNVRFSNNILIEGIIKQRFQIYDLDSVQLLFNLNHLILNDEQPKGYDNFMTLSKDKQQEILNDIFNSPVFKVLIDKNANSKTKINLFTELNKSFPNLPSFNENFINNIELYHPGQLSRFIDTFYNLLHPETYKYFQKDLFKLGEGYNKPDKLIYVNGELIEPIDVEHDAYEVVMPKIYKTQFGLQEYDDLQEILRDKDFFIKRGLNRFKCKLSNHNLYNYELKNFNGDHVYILDKSEGIPDELVGTIFNIEHIKKSGKIYRIDDNQGVMYQMSSEDDFVCKIDGVEIIITDNPLFYVNNLNYNTLKVSHTRVTQKNYEQLINSLSKSKRSNAQNYLKAITDPKYKRYFTLEEFKKFNLKLDDLTYATVKRDDINADDFKSIAQICRIILQTGRELHASFDESLNLIAGRIPAQSQQSFMPQRVIAFDNVDRNTAMVSTFQLFLQGSDLDIDAVTLIGYSFDKNGKFIKWSPYFNITSKENLKASKNIPLPTGKTSEIITGENAKNNFFEVYNKYFGTLFIPIKNGDENEKTKDGTPKLQLNIYTPERLKLLANFLKDFNKYGIQIKADVNSNGELNVPSEFFNAPGLQLENGKTISMKWNLFRNFNEGGEIAAEYNQTYQIAQQLLWFVNNHNNYINTVDDYLQEGMSKNYLVHYIYKVSIDPRNQTECQESIDKSTKIGKQEASKYESNDFAPGGFESKYMCIGEGQAGKDCVGIGATAIKANSTTQYYISKTLKHGSNEDLQYILFRKPIVINGKSYRGFANMYTDIESDPTRSNFEKVLEVINSQEHFGHIPRNVAIGIGALLSLAVDNAKDLALKKINSGTKSMGMYAYGLSLGIPLEELTTIINSPEGKLLVQLTEGCLFNNDISSFKIIDVFDKLNGQLGQEIKQYKEVPRNNDGRIAYFEPGFPEIISNGNITFPRIGNTLDALFVAMSKAYYDWHHETIKDKRIAESLEQMVQQLFEYNAFEEVYKKIDNNIINSYINHTINTSGIDVAANIKASIYQLKNYLLNMFYKSQRFKQSKHSKDLKILAEGAEEMRILGAILSINKGLKASISDTETFIDLIENLICDRKKILKMPILPGDKIDFQKFMTDKNYQNIIIQKYDTVKHSINIPHLLIMAEHFNGYLQTELIPISFFTISSIKYRTLQKYRKDVNYDTNLKEESLFDLFGVESKKDKDSVLRGLENLIHFKLFTRWAYNKKLTFTIPKGFAYFTKKTQRGQDDVTITNDENIPIPLYTEAGLASFKKYIEEYYIPTLQKDPNLKNNSFVRNLIPHEYDKTPLHNEVSVYTLHGDMMAKKGRQYEMNQKMFADFRNLANYQINGLSVHDAFYIYSQYCYMGKKGQTSLMSLFDSEESSSTLCDSFRKYEAEQDVNGNINCSREELINWCAPVTNQNSNVNYAYVTGRNELSRSLKIRAQENSYVNDDNYSDPSDYSDLEQQGRIIKPENFITYKSEYLTSQYDQIVRDHFLVPSTQLKIEQTFTIPFSLNGESFNCEFFVKSGLIYNIYITDDSKLKLDTIFQNNPISKYKNSDEFINSLLKDLDTVELPYKTSLYKNARQEVDLKILQTIIEQKLNC